MNLRQYVGEYVIVEFKNGQIRRGQITDYFFPEDNENDKESVIIDECIEFYEDDIVSIALLPDTEIPMRRVRKRK